MVRIFSCCDKGIKMPTRSVAPQHSGLGLAKVVFEMSLERQQCHRHECVDDHVDGADDLRIPESDQTKRLNNYEPQTDSDTVTIAGVSPCP